MAQIHGSLRDDKATYGEKVVLSHLEQNLPKEFAVYVECPLNDHRQLRYPDFIVSTNYGVIVLEVKDWVEILKATKYQVTLRTRENKIRTEGNPVETAREYAILLNNELRRLDNGNQRLQIPWGFAVVLPNLPNSVITQLRAAWGEEFVFNTNDLKAHVVTNRLKNTLPVKHIRSLSRRELGLIRATINPVVLIEQPERTVILDEQQEVIVTEPIKERPAQKLPDPVQVEQIGFLEEEKTNEPAEVPVELLDYELELSRNAAVRLVRGIAGSGKSLVLAQRARYLASMYPEWNILVLTFNKELRKHLDARFKGVKNIQTRHFHGICSSMMYKYRTWNPTGSDGWLERFKDEFPIIQQFGVDYLADEIEWLFDLQISSFDQYADTSRKGRVRVLGAQQRQQVFEVFQAYKAYLDQEGLFDWAEIPHILLDGINKEQINPKTYDAILIDEAQDFAPGWIRLVTRLLAKGGIMFLADDPTQSIYRLYSWREKGVQVVGRTRWLKVPYRNTYEIYKAAYQIIASDEALQKSLEEEGVLVVPELNSGSMRHGPKPLLRHYANFGAEISNVQHKIQYLLQSGIASQQIAVLHRTNAGVKKLKETLRGTDVQINTFHAFKGMEFEAVFLCQVNETSVTKDSEEARQKERRLVYMAMTRAREHLFLGFSEKLPGKFRKLDGYVDYVS